MAVHFARQKITRVSTARDLAMQVLQEIGLEHCADRLAGNISFGDQKRLGLARALAGDPELLLCDEICGGLTRTETRSMLDLLKRIRDRGMTIMCVERCEGDHCDLRSHRRTELRRKTVRGTAGRNSKRSRSH